MGGGSVFVEELLPQWVRATVVRTAMIVPRTKRCFFI